ncbi:MAG: diguanylate cyclase [Idiomarina sp.]|nr:diguanylate cyclase [Idiomarina sp.]
MVDSIKHNDSLHWMMQMLQTIEVGLVVLNRQGQVQLWNSFMENHSGVRVSTARERNLFELFPELPRDWMERKINAVFKLKSRAYSTWEQRPHLFRFQSARPLTSQAPLMFQNLTLTPLLGSDGEVSHVCMLIYDVTDIAINKLGLESANDALETLSQTDRLSGLFNRGHWEECLVDEFHRLTRYRGTGSLILFDIDHFKPVNDNYGHHVGDQVIKDIGSIIGGSLRDTDKAGRYGGEEFAILLPETDAPAALLLAERLRKQIESHTFKVEGIAINVTVSLGIAEFEARFSNHVQWIEAADKALYSSKHCGRNRTSLSSKT